MVAGRPQPTVAWFVNDRLADGFIEESGQNVVVSRFTEQHVLRRHRGTRYRCQASNTMKTQPLEKTVRLEMNCEYFELFHLHISSAQRGKEHMAGFPHVIGCP